MHACRVTGLNTLGDWILKDNTLGDWILKDNKEDNMGSRVSSLRASPTHRDGTLEAYLIVCSPQLECMQYGRCGKCPLAAL